MSQVNLHAADTSARTSRRRRYALLLCMAGGFIVFLDVSIVNVALPTISSQLHASGSLLQWIVSGYSLAFGLLLVPAGRPRELPGPVLAGNGTGTYGTLPRSISGSRVCCLGRWRIKVTR